MFTCLTAHLYATFADRTLSVRSERMPVQIIRNSGHSLHLDILHRPDAPYYVARFHGEVEPMVGHRLRVGGTPLIRTNVIIWCSLLQGLFQLSGRELGELGSRRARHAA